MTAGVTSPPLYCEDILYAAYVDRLLIKSLGVQAGVVEAEDYKVSAGTGLQVNVKAGKAFVEETKAIEESSNTFYNGLYNVLNPTEQNPYNNVEVSAVNPQIAQIILRVYDVGELKIGGSSYARIEWLNGSPNVNATEAKMKEGIYEGRAALPQSSFRLTNILVPKNASKSSEYYIEDARKWSGVGNWIEPVMNSKVSSSGVVGSQTFRVREEQNGKIVRLRGYANVKSGEKILKEEKIATLPLNLSPLKNFGLPYSTGYTFESGSIYSTEEKTSLQTWNFEGVTYNLT